MRRLFLATQKNMGETHIAHWMKDLPFHEHLTRLAPAASVSETEIRGKKAKKPYKRTKQPHVPMVLDCFLHGDGEGSEGTEAPADDSTLRLAGPHCRCHSCTGFRLHTFVLYLMDWGPARHFLHCSKGEPCTVFCPGRHQPLSIYDPASLTVEHLEEAERFGWDVQAVLTGVGFGPGYRPHHGRFPRSEDNGMYDLGAVLDGYKLTLHMRHCNPSTPCKSWCHKPADQLTPADIRNAKEKFPEWQRRMLVSEGMAAVVRREATERKKRKAERQRKVKSLLRPDRRWSEAPLELADFLGVYPRRLHSPTCCPEVPCVSLCVCFPGKVSSSG